MSVASVTNMRYAALLPEIGSPTNTKANTRKIQKKYRDFNFSFFHELSTNVEKSHIIEMPLSLSLLIVHIGIVFLLSP